MSQVIKPKYFEWCEILSPDGLRHFDCGHLLIQGFAIKALDSIREMIGEPILVNHSGLHFRGYRSVAENTEIEISSRFSRHIQGIAFDCTVKSKDYSRLIYAAVMCGARGIGWYPQRNFLHIDFRTSDSIWCWIQGDSINKSFRVNADKLESYTAAEINAELRSSFLL